MASKFPFGPPGSDAIERRIVEAKADADPETMRRLRRQQAAALRRERGITGITDIDRTNPYAPIPKAEPVKAGGCWVRRSTSFGAERVWIPEEES